MKCHYSVLGVESNCSSDDLKKAYRKLALEWHPDKNLDRLEEAKENFLLIQQAYEILSDPQERAWYDRHKDDILRGGAEEAYKDDCLDVYRYFTTSCFKGYNDEEKGFYTVYRQVFEKITAEDKPFMDDDEMEVPQFGYSDSSYEEVVHEFYAYWQSYCTAKTFSWVDKYDLSEARKSGAGRQVIRLMEKENKKLRDQHKKLRNEEVRELVAFVRKRDKRVQAAKKRMEETKAEKAKKAEEQRRKQVVERNKAFEDYKEAEWSSMSQFENHLNELESSLDATFGSSTYEANEDDDEFDDLSDLYCVACEKDFRSDKAFKNHENSKKHKENVALLKSLMEEEEAMAQNAGDNCSEDVPPDSDQEESTSKDLLDELIKSSTKSKSKKKKKKTKPSANNDTGLTATLAEVELEVADMNITEDSPDNNSVQNNLIVELENDENGTSNSEQRNDSSRQTKQADTQKLSKKSIPAKKKGKKDKEQKIEIDTIDSDDETKEKQPTACGTCSSIFQSRNKLFEHLRQTGHAVYKNENSASGKKQKKKKL